MVTLIGYSNPKGDFVSLRSAEVLKIEDNIACLLKGALLDIDCLSLFYNRTKTVEVNGTTPGGHTWDDRDEVIGKANFYERKTNDEIIQIINNQIEAKLTPTEIKFVKDLLIELQNKGLLRETFTGNTVNFSTPGHPGDSGSGDPPTEPVSLSSGQVDNILNKIPVKEDLWSHLAKYDHGDKKILFENLKEIIESLL